MLISFGEYTFHLQSWQDKREMMRWLEGCKENNLLFGEDAEQELEFFSTDIYMNSDSSAAADGFKVGICSEGHGLKPHLLMLHPERAIIVFGFNRDAVGFNIKTKSISFRIKLDSLFRSLVHLVRQKMILVFHEIGVVAIDENGQKLWRYEKDVITGYALRNDILHLQFMDSSSINLSILRGT